MLIVSLMRLNFIILSALVVDVSDGEAFTSISHGFKLSSIIISNPIDNTLIKLFKTSKVCSYHIIQMNDDQKI